MPESDPPAPPRPRGRPRAVERGTCVSTWIPTATYDRLWKVAQARDLSLSALVRDVIAKKLR